MRATPGLIPAAAPLSHGQAGGQAPALRRLAALTRLDEAALAALESATRRAHHVRARGELAIEKQPVREPLLLLEGWAARVRNLSDGRRQLISFVLPGELLGYRRFKGALASSTVTALTPVTICPLPPEDASPTLAHAVALSRELDEGHLMAQVTRLGRLNAYERIIDLLLELYERLTLSGLARDGSFAMPITQETLSDALGLTPVHVNRTLQQARQAGDLRWNGGTVTLRDPDALAAAIGRAPAMVAAPEG